MEITVNDRRKIFAIQKEFSDMFPFLKLEFYSKPHKQGGTPSLKLVKHISKTIAECRTVHSSGFITVQPQMTVGEMEQAFRDIYGLTVQVFHKTAGMWYESAENESATLEKLNIEGKVLNQVENTV